MNLHQWRKQIRNFNDSFKGHKEIFKQWEKHTKANIPRFNKENSIWNLEWKYYRGDEKAMVLVGSSPCLKRDINKLKELDDNFLIVCANSSLRYLVKHRIKPQYCISLDSDDIDIPQHLDCDSSDITLLASSVTSPKALDNWKGPIYFMPYYSVSKKCKDQLRRKLGKAVYSGGNSMTSALYLVSVIFGSKTVIFVANEYCFDKVEDYYADKTAAKQEILNTVYPVVDVNGKQRWTIPGLYTYVIWTEKVCMDLTPPGFFIDTSFGMLGKDCKAIHLMELSEAIKKVKSAFKTTKRLNKAKTEDDRLKIIRSIIPKDEPSEVFHYNMQEHRERLLQLARS
jgi:hypothetical protein